MLIAIVTKSSQKSLDRVRIGDRNEIQGEIFEKILAWILKCVCSYRFLISSEGKYSNYIVEKKKSDNTLTR